MSFLGIVGAVVAFLSVCALLAGAVVVYRSSMLTRTAELWKDEADALHARLTTVEEAEHECQERVTKLELANRVLAETVSGATAVALLSKQIDKHFTDVMALLGGARRDDSDT